MHAADRDRWPLYVVARAAGRNGFELIGPLGCCLGVGPAGSRWRFSARVAVKEARVLLRHGGGRIWVFRPDGRFYREIRVR